MRYLDCLKTMEVLSDMNQKIQEGMDELLLISNRALVRGEESYSQVTDQLDYFPMGWESVYTYINENLLRLANLYSADEPDVMKIMDKWIDLFNYVRMGYAVMEHVRETEEA